MARHDEMTGGGTSGNGEEPVWERELLKKVVLSSLVEQRRARRWGIFFKFLTFAYLAALLVIFLPSELTETIKKGERHTALVEIDGVIGPDLAASADTVVTGLRDAFEDPNTAGVILRINSPGGSPVQSAQIHREIRRLRQKYEKIPLHVVVQDVCASGGYYVAAAADRIYADPSSIVGSIGVLMNGFGFVDALDKLGIERRLLTAGEHKGMLDPFSPVAADERAHVQTLLAQLHRQFIDAVKEGRGERLALDQQERLFSGLFWSGEEGKALGLVDDFASASQVARDVIGAETIVDFTPKEDVWTRFADRLGASLADGLARLGGFNSGLR